MKLNYKSCLDMIEKNTGKRPGHSEISKITSVSANALSNRLSNDGYLKDEEIKKLEKHYKINFTDTLNHIELDYYPDFFNSKYTEKISVSKKCFEVFNDIKEDKQYYAIKIYGNGMSPYIEDSDKVIVEKWEGKQILDENIYVFQFKNKYFIKRLIENVNQIIIKSDNAEYPTRFIEKDELNSIKIIGQIVGLIRDVD